MSQKTYDSTGILVQNNANIYQEFKQQFITNIAKVNLINNANTNCLGCIVMPSGFFTPEGLNVCGYPRFSFFTGNNKTGQMKIVSSETTIDGVTNSESITYDDNLLVKKTENPDSYTNHKRIKEYIYPTDPSYNFDAEALEMRYRNMISIPLETIEKEDLNGTINTIFHQKTIYNRFIGNNTRSFTNNTSPSEIWVAPTGTTLEKRVEFTNYDSDGNPTEYKVDNIPTTLFWGYGGNLLLGQIQNALQTDVNNALIYANIDAPTYSLTSLSNTQLADLQTFRNSFSNSLVTWYTYRPNVGLSSIIAPNGLKSRFFYDGFQRLNFTQDNENNKLAEISYQYGTPNRITTKQYRVPELGNLPENDPNFITTHAYFDGLGRPIQKVGEAQSPQAKDIVFGTQTYDKYSRLSDELTIYPSEQKSGSYKSNGLSVAQAFYKDTYPNSMPVYEESPLNRISRNFGLGNAWRVADKKTELFYESAGTDIKYYTADASGNIMLNGTYPANSLYKKRTKDEQGNTTIEITDKRGRLIQRQQQLGNDWLTTYFINDGLGRELAILQPNAFALNSSISQSSADWSNGVFFYKYDNRGRMIEKHVPNAGFMYMVYDKADRAVLSQDAHQKTLKRWSFTKYDGLSREVLNGEGLIDSSRVLLQGFFDTHTVLSESFDSNLPTQHFYTNLSFPFGVDSSRAMQINYYDDYTAWRTTPFNPTVSFYTDSKGLLTGIKKRYSENRQLLTNAMYHDSKNRNIETKKQDILGNIESIRRTYRLMGGESSYQRFYSLGNGNGSFYFSRANNYDRTERKSNFSLYMNMPDNTEINIETRYEYNEIGQLITQKIQPNQQYQIQNNGQNIINRPPALDQPNTQDIANNAVIIIPPFKADSLDEVYIAEIDTIPNNGIVNALQTINYEYHLRGQLNCINFRNKQVRPNPKENDLFSMKLDFEGDNRYFDGNISRQIWKNPLTTKNQIYKHSYDGASRLTKSVYSGGNSGSNFSLDTVRYDPNGNILQLKRHTIDDLSYLYNGNQLLKVSDLGTIAGFKDGSNSGNDYEYWNDGSLKSDKNKGIDSIFYNSFLRKVSRVKFTNNDWINFYYDGAGTLLKRTLSNGDVWIYRDDLIMKNGTIYQINHDEGRVIYDNTNTKWLTEFDYRDIWGNLRLSFRDSLAIPISGVYKPPVITQSSDFDMIGFEINSFSNQNKNNYKFQKQERISDYDLDIDFFKFRPSDSKIGRFWQIDPLASKYVYNSPYALQENKFGRGVEFEGLEVVFFGQMPPVITTRPMIFRPIALPKGGAIETLARTVPIRQGEASVSITQEHHINPNGVKDHPVVQEARNEGFKQDGKENKMDVEKYDKLTNQGRHGNHPEYNKEVKGRYDDFAGKNPTRTGKESLDFVRNTVKDLKQTIENNPNTKINDLFQNNVVPADNTRNKAPDNPLLKRTKANYSQAQLD